jgi:hypothetical protein
MKELTLVSILREIVDQHPVHKKIDSELLRIAQLGADAEERESSGKTEEEKPVYEGQTSTMDLQQMIDYIGGLSPETVVEVPRVYPGGFGSDIVTRTTVGKAIKQLSDVLNSEDHNKEQFELTQDSPTFKSFSVVISPEELERRTAMVRSMGPLD